MNDLGPKHAIGERTASTKLLDARFAKLEVGEIVTDQEIAAITGQPVTGVVFDERTKMPVKTCYSAVLSAIKIARRDRRHSLARVRGVGIKRLDDAGASDLVHKKNQEAFRKAKVGVQIGSTIDRDKLTTAEKGAFDLRYATARLLTASAKLKAVPQFSEPVLRLIAPEEVQTKKA